MPETQIIIMKTKSLSDQLALWFRIFVNSIYFIEMYIFLLLSLIILQEVVFLMHFFVENMYVYVAIIKNVFNG